MTLGTLFGTEAYDATAYHKAGQPSLEETTKVYAEMLQAALKGFPARVGFSLIELLQFTATGRRSCAIAYSGLPEARVGEILGKHYDIIRELKQQPGMNWSLMSSDVVQYGGDILFCPQDGSGAEVGQPPQAGRWSPPVIKELPPDYAPDTIPSFADVTAKCEAYLERIAPLLPRTAAVSVLVVPFSIPATGVKLGAAFALVAGDQVLPPDTVSDLYRNFQLFWLRFRSGATASAAGPAAA